jgi:hypothetical protein
VYKVGQRVASNFSGESDHVFIAGDVSPLSSLSLFWKRLPRL